MLSFDYNCVPPVPRISEYLELLSIPLKRSTIKVAFHWILVTIAKPPDLHRRSNHKKHQEPKEICHCLLTIFNILSGSVSGNDTFNTCRHLLGVIGAASSPRMWCFQAMAAIHNLTVPWRENFLEIFLFSMTTTNP